MNADTTTLQEIQNILRVSNNQVKNLMKKNGIQHDGSPEMRYSTTEAQKVIDKHLHKTELIRQSREKRSKRRRGILHETMRAPINNEGLSRREVSELWNVDAYHVKDAIKHGLIPVLDNGKISESFAKESCPQQIMDLLFAIKEKELVENEEILTSGEYDNKTANQADQFQQGKGFVANVSVNIPRRNQPLEYVGFHLGPTNSGKTYKALENLAEEFIRNPQGKYVYSGPLRMLAYEVYVKMCHRFGADNVGFVTGEESVNPEAPIIASTTEMAPMEGDVIVIDEAHWILDEERGHYWTKLLLRGNYRTMHIIAAQEASEGLQELVSDAVRMESETFVRRTGISFDGKTLLRKIKPKTAVVCFSRRDVYKVYELLLRLGVKACVLYGALPVEVRKKQIHDYENGLFDVVITTNVIGHGINLPIDNVIFAGTERFDGSVRIELPLWEAGQISGRAGRFGLSDKGSVSVIEGVDKMTPDPDIVRGGVNVASGRESSQLEVVSPYIFPKFDDLGLGVNDQQYLIEALNSWSDNVSRTTNFTPAPMRVLRTNVKALVEHLNLPMQGLYAPRKASQWKISTKDLWLLVSGPFDSRSGVILTAGEWLGSNGNHAIIAKDFLRLVKFDNKSQLANLETSFTAVSEFKMLSVVFGDDSGKLGTLSRDSILDAESSIIRLIQHRLDTYPQQHKGKGN